MFSACTRVCGARALTRRMARAGAVAGGLHESGVGRSRRGRSPLRGGFTSGFGPVGRADPVGVLACATTCTGNSPYTLAAAAEGPMQASSSTEWLAMLADCSHPGCGRNTGSAAAAATSTAPSGAKDSRPSMRRRISSRIPTSLVTCRAAASGDVAVRAPGPATAWLDALYAPGPYDNGVARRRGASWPAQAGCKRATGGDPPCPEKCLCSRIYQPLWPPGMAGGRGVADPAPAKIDARHGGLMGCCAASTGRGARMPLVRSLSAGRTRMGDAILARILARLNESR